MAQNILMVSQPSNVELLGERIPLYFSLRAAARMEEALEMDYPTIVKRLFEQETGEAPDELTGIAPKYPALPLIQQAMVAAIVICEGERTEGKLPPDGWMRAAQERRDWMLELHMSDYHKLAVAVTHEILTKTRRDQPGNA